MNYFNINIAIFIVPPNKCTEKFAKTDKSIVILNKTDVGKIIEKVQKRMEEMVIIPLKWLQQLFIAFQNLKVQYVK